MDKSYSYKIILKILIIYLCFLNNIFGETIDKSNTYKSNSKSIQFSNDIFFNKDHKISNVISFQKHSEIVDKIEDISLFPKYLNKFKVFLPNSKTKSLQYRSTISISQTIQTPKNLSTEDLILGDVPYAGALTVEFNIYSFNDSYFKGIGITAGVVGPFSFAKQTQKIIHTIIQDVNPKGWGNQIETEPIINLDYLIQKKIYSNPNDKSVSFDTLIFADISAGNLFSHFGTGLELRFGYNMPKGFNYTPDPTTFNMKFNALISPELSDKYSFYFTLKIQGNYVYNNLFFDGNSFTSSYYVEKENYIGQLFTGFHFENKKWGIHINFLITSDNVNNEFAPLAKGGEKLGSIIFDWRF